MKLITQFLLLTCCSLALAAADKPTNAGMLDRWVGGKWVGDGQFFDTAYSKANKATSTTKCAWSPDHIFVVCDQDINFGGTPLRDLSVYTFAPKTGKFYFYGISLGEDKARNTGLDVSEDGTRWTYSSSDEIQGKPVQFRTTNQFHGNDAVEWWSEFSTDDGKSWTKTGEGKESRQR